MDQIYEWDDDKAEANWQKHHVSFDEAVTVFDDPREITSPDPQHSTDEDRFISVGRSQSGQILTVVFTERDQRLRIISARQATRRERRQYE